MLPCYWQIVFLFQNWCDAPKNASAVSAIIKCRAQYTKPESWQPNKTKRRTQKRHRKDTEKKRKTSNFFSDEAKFGLQTSPRREDLVFYWFQTSPAEVRPRSQTLPLMSCSPVRAIQNLYFFRQKTSKKLIFAPK